MRVPVLAFMLFVFPASALADDAGAARPNPPVLKEMTGDFPKGEQVEYRVMTATLQPGAVSPWHTHPAPVAVYVEDGTFTLERKSGEAVSLKAGEAYLEPIDVEVRAANRDTVPTTVVIFQVSSPTDPFLKPTQ